MFMPVQTLHSDAVRDLEDFIRARWLHIGGKGGLDGIEAAGGPVANSVRKLCEIEAGIRKRMRRSSLNNEIAIFLRYRDWDEMQASFERNDVLWGLPVIRLSPEAMRRVRGNVPPGQTLEEWINDIIVRAIPDRA